MFCKHARSIYTVGYSIQEKFPMILDQSRNQILNGQQLRYIKKHWDPKHKKLRAAKVYRPTKELLKMFDSSVKFTPEEERSHRKRLNLYLDQHHVIEDNVAFRSTGQLIDPYDPPDGDGKFSFTKGNIKKSLTTPVMKLLHLQKIKSMDIEFDKATFAQIALEKYKKAHEAMMRRDEEDLCRYVTPVVYALMLKNAERKTIRWEYLGSIEEPRMVKTCMGEEDTVSVFAQITVRFHSEQKLAIYDRFGRLIQGSEILRKDVLEYVVFEKNLALRYCPWRIAGKIMPGLSPFDESPRTYVVTEEDVTDDLQESKEEAVLTNN